MASSTPSEPALPATVVASAGSISVIICSKDRRALLEKAVASVRECDELGAAVEIVVVEETDEPETISGTRYVQLTREGRGFGHTRNVGVASAGGDILVFTDDDCEAHPNWLQNLVRPFATDATIIGTAGSVHVADCGPIGYAENILGFPGGGIRYEHDAGGQPVSTTLLSTCNCAYRRSAIEAAGGFPEDAPFSGEDSLLAERVQAHGECVYVPDARVSHLARDSLGKIFHWFTRRGGSETLMLTEGSRSGAHAWRIVRSSWAIRMALLFAALYAWPTLWLALPFLALGYYGAILFRYRFALSYPDHRRAWLIVPIVKLTMDLGMEVGRFKSWFHHAKR